MAIEDYIFDLLEDKVLERNQLMIDQYGEDWRTTGFPLQDQGYSEDVTSSIKSAWEKYHLGGGEETFRIPEEALFSPEIWKTYSDQYMQWDEKWGNLQEGHYSPEIMANVKPWNPMKMVDYMQEGFDPALSELGIVGDLYDEYVTLGMPNYETYQGNKIIDELQKLDEVDLNIFPEE
jgi:hypothetical protein